ncbi:holothin acyltransferase-like [Haliotis asinina]|uniref:holothin acyltransferase-like n=1 Tax=Haliotis asinina TaxID=109174 RepID=UPI003532449D
MATVPVYKVRNATKHDIPAIKAFCDSEKWDVDTKYLQCMFDMDSRGWFVAESESGEVIGLRVLEHYDENTTAGGMYIVKKELRGMGIGHAVNSAALSAVGDTNVVLAATNVNLYNTQGFTYDCDSYERRGSASVIMAALPEDQTDKEITIMPYEDSMLSELMAYDRSICEFERSYFFQNWIIKHTKAIVVARSSSGVIAGYGCLRYSDYGDQVAPLYAEKDVIAWSLMRALLENVDPNLAVKLFIPSGNKPMFERIGRLSLEDISTTYRMYRTKRLPSSLDKVFSLTFWGLTII